MTTTDHLMNFLAGQLADNEVGWSIGTFGAIAEFTRDPDEPAELHQTCDTLSVVTSRGGLRIVPRPGLRAIASESPTTESWSHRVALCLPHDSCAMGGRNMLTKIGEDGGALHGRHRHAPRLIEYCVVDRACGPVRDRPAAQSVRPRPRGFVKIRQVASIVRSTTNTQSRVLARLRHPDCVEQCQLSGVTRKTFACTELFSV